MKKKTQKKTLTDWDWTTLSAHNRVCRAVETVKKGETK